MYTRRNTRNQTKFVGTQASDVELYLSTPFPKAKKASRLTVRSGETRIDLNGRQINALRKVLAAAYKA